MKIDFSFMTTLCVVAPLLFYIGLSLKYKYVSPMNSLNVFRDINLDKDFI